MINLQELFNNLLLGVDAADKTIRSVLDDTDNLDGFIEHMKYMINEAHSMSCLHHQSLAYIISEYYDGEFVMTEAEINTCIQGYNFFIDITKNDDGSVMISTYKEKQE